MTFRKLRTKFSMSQTRFGIKHSGISFAFILHTRGQFDKMLDGWCPNNHKFFCLQMTQEKFKTNKEVCPKTPMVFFFVVVATQIVFDLAVSKRENL